MKNKKNIFSILLAILLVVGMLSISTLTAFAADTYTVTFDIGDGTGTVAPMTGVFDTVAHFPEGPTPPEGMAFYAWVEDVNTENYKKTGSSFRIKKNTTYHAVYFPVEGLFTYRINQDDVTVMECVQSATGEVVVPGTYAGKPVTRIYKDAFKNCSTITSVVLPESIMEIDSHAFDNCNQMESIELPNHPMKFGLNAFIHCEALKSIVLPRDSEYGFGMFGNCISLEEITLPDDMREIPMSFFSYCESLTELTLPASVETISYGAFASCHNLKKLVLPEGLQDIDMCVFEECNALSEIIIPRSVNHLNKETFLDYNGTVLVYANSYAHTFCEENGIAYALVPSVQVGQVTLNNGEYTTDGQSTTTTKPESGGYAHYDNGVLTLNNFTYSGGGGNGSVIYATTDLTVHAVGNNTIDSTEKYAVHLQGGNLTITGDVLNLTVSDLANAYMTVLLYDSVNYTHGSLKLSGVTLNVQYAGGASASQIYGIICGDVTIDSSVLNIDRSEGTNESRSSEHGLKSYGAVEIKNNSRVVIDLRDGMQSAGLFVESANISITDSYVELRANGNHGVGLSFNTSYNTLDFNGGTLIIAGTHVSDGAAYLYAATFELPAGDYWWRTDENGSYTKTGYVYSKDHTYIELTTTDPHTHSYTYSANGAVITESCTCGHSETATIVVPKGELVYEGIEHKAEIEYSVGWVGNKDYELVYLVDGNTPTYFAWAGTYNVSLTVEGAVATSSYTIKKSPNEMKNIEDVSKTYDGTAVKNPDFQRTTFSDGDVSYAYKPYGADDSEYTNQAPKNAGKYTCRITMAEVTNYEEAVATVDFVISKATPTAPTTPAGVNTTFIDTTDGKITGVDSTMEYRKEGDTNYTAVTGTEITGLAAGKYYVRYAEKANYNPSPDKEITISLGDQRTPTVDTEPTASRVIIDGKLSDSTLTGGVASVPGEFAWVNPDAVMNTAGKIDMLVRFTPTDTATYNTVDFEIEVEVVVCDTTSGEHDYTDLQTSTTEHWYICIVCDEEKAGSRVEHSGGTATCTDLAVCTVCNTAYGSVDGDSHDYLSAWVLAVPEHYHECSHCGHKKDVAAHGYDNDCDKTCNACGYIRQVTHSAPVLVHNGTHHWYECSVCGGEQENSREMHTGGTATCMSKAVCTVCNTAYGEIAPDNHDFATTLTAGAEEHYYACTRCGTKKDRAAHSFGGRIPNGDGTHTGTCVCGKTTKEACLGGTATCEAKAVCTVCSAPYGDFAAHGDTELRGQKEATCAQAGYTGDTHCKACGEKLESGSEISKLDHTFEWVIDKEATETEDGVKHEECACGAKQNENTAIPKTGAPLPPEPAQPDGLSTGAIVAIIIACIIVLAGGGFAIWWFVFKKKKLE